MTANPSGTGGYVLTCESGVWIAQITAAAPTSTAHVATKSYVDSAVAAAGGGIGGGVCYYALTGASCGAGFQQMPGNAAFYSGGTSIICCTGSSSLGDTTPTAFDFPDSPVIGFEASYTWTAVQITGFDWAPVSISGPSMQYRICADSGCANVVKNWKSSTDIINNNEYLQIRTTSARSQTATVVVGDMSDTTRVNAPWTVFVTAGTWDGDLGGVTGADSRCQSEASSAQLPGTYRAWVSVSATSEPLDRFENVGSPIPFALVTGTVVANNWSDLIDGSLSAAISRDATGTARNVNVWTNTNTNGSVITTNNLNNCITFANGSGTRDGRVGDSTRSTSAWTNDDVSVCSNLGGLYCFQTQ